jgi:hypothetical protein
VVIPPFGLAVPSSVVPSKNSTAPVSQGVGWVFLQREQLRAG